MTKSKPTKSARSVKAPKKSAKVDKPKKRVFNAGAFERARRNYFGLDK